MSTNLLKVQFEKDSRTKISRFSGPSDSSNVKVNPKKRKIVKMKKKSRNECEEESNDLNESSTKKTKQKLYDKNRKYLDIWEGDFPWLTGVFSGGEKIAYCKWCHKSLQAHRGTLNKHERGSQHIDRAQTYSMKVKHAEFEPPERKILYSMELDSDAIVTNSHLEQKENKMGKKSNEEISRDIETLQREFPWLTTLITNDEKIAFCELCLKSLRSDKHSLKMHAKGGHHQRAAQQSNTISDNSSVELQTVDESILTQLNYVYGQNGSEVKAPLMKKDSEMYRKYLKSWEKTFTWVTSVKSGGTEFAYCKCCRKFIKPHKGTLNKHNRSAVHQKVFSEKREEMDNTNSMFAQKVLVKVMSSGKEETDVQKEGHASKDDFESSITLATPHKEISHELSTYAQHIANELRQIDDKRTLALTKHKINTIIFEATSGLLAQDIPHRQTNSTSFPT